VRAHAAGDARQARHARVAPVSGDDQAAAQVAALVCGFSTVTPVGRPLAISCVAVHPAINSTPGVSAVIRRSSGSSTRRVTL
jgi:hypothetical protein